jgi:aspartate aminotransferase-like enzyme
VKNRLFTPGPTPVPELVALRMAAPIIHHRHPEFREIAARLSRNLQYLFQTTQPVVTLTCSGTGGMEATFVSLFSPGDKIIAVNGGKFGARWVTMPRAFGLQAAEVTVPWGDAVTPDELRRAIRRHPDAAAVYLTHSETSTGTACDVRSLAQIVHDESKALICVDGISAVGALEFRFDEWGIDVCVTGSQKGVMIPPGLAFVALSLRAQDATKRSSMPRYYFDLQRALASHATHDTPWTPAISLAIGADAALEMIRAEGIEQVWARHRRLARALRSGVDALGLNLFSRSPSDAVTALWVPDGISWTDFNRTLRMEAGITVAGGQEEYRGKIFRISHLGYYDDMDMLAVVAGLERSLAVHGHAFTPGTGVAATQSALLEEN